MNFTEQGNKPNFLSLTLIAVAHIVVFALVIQSINGRMIFSPPPPLTMATIESPPPPPLKKELPPPKPDFAPPPPMFVPKVEVDVPTPVTQKDIVITDKVPAEFTPPLVVDPGPPAADPVKVALHKPVHVAAVIDAKNCEKPDYPRNALRNGDAGTVKLALLVGIDGRVHDSKIEKSSGFRELDNAAQTGLSLCKFKPASIDGVPQQAWAKMEYVWKVD